MATRMLPDSERRWLRALLVLGTITVGLILLGLLANVLLFFSDILLVFLLAWLLAFVLSPIVSLTLRAFPTLPRVAIVIVIYLGILVALTALVLLLANTLAGSISGFLVQLPSLQDRLPDILQPWEERLRGLGLNVDLVTAAQGALAGLGNLGTDLVRPLTDLALASLGIVGNLILVIFLSLFIVLDKDRLSAFLNRLVPPRYSDEARLFEQSVASSFGGFIRGQAIQGLFYAVFAVATHLVLGLEFTAASAALVGLLQTVPFFGPFFSWAPPVIVAVLSDGNAILPAAAIMGIGWFVVMNIVQPRVMASAVGIHPIVVLASVLIGLKLQGIIGAIFAIPFAAVISAFFFHYLNRSVVGGPRDVASRAARRLEEREGRFVRVPTAPALPAAGPPTSATGIVTPGAPTTPGSSTEGGASPGAGTGTASTSGAAPGTAPGTTPGTAPGTTPGAAPGATPDPAPGTSG